MKQSSSFAIDTVDSSLITPVEHVEEAFVLMGFEAAREGLKGLEVL